MLRGFSARVPLETERVGFTQYVYIQRADGAMETHQSRERPDSWPEIRTVWEVHVSRVPEAPRELSR